MPGQQQLPYRMPPLYLPVPAVPHPQAETIHAGIANWFERTGLAQAEDHLAIHRRFEYDRLYTLCHQTGGADKLVLIAPLWILLMLADNPATGDRYLPDLLAGLPGAVEGLATGQIIQRISDPATEHRATAALTRAFLHSLREIQAGTETEKYERTVDRLAEYIRGEIAAHLRKDTAQRPGFAQALRAATLSSGMMVAGAYMAIAYPRLSHRLTYSPQLERIWMLSATVVRLHNELYSGYGPKDTAENLVQTAAREFGLSVQDAADYVGELADRCVSEALRQIDHLRAEGADQDLLDYASVGLTYAAAGLDFCDTFMRTRYYQPDVDQSQIAVTFSDTPTATGAPGIDGLDALFGPAAGSPADCLTGTARQPTGCLS
ncbi:terpene synthase family protein [Streptomyces sp. NPDC014870]|uniref:terpene synthase family protein n=1 Tax=Streptomyces sp. NPDC014870 TaxID=3364925 RepID=UPI0037032370